MPVAPRPRPEQTPPRGVPRWLWPPPGAEVRSLRITERSGAGGEPDYSIAAGQAPEPKHLRALAWLLDEHDHAQLPSSGTRFEGEIRLEIARTAMPGGRVGHAYALNGGPIGAPSGRGARGILVRYIRATLAG